MKCTADAGNGGQDLREYCRTLTLRAKYARDSREGAFLAALYRVIANGGTIVAQPSGEGETTLIFRGCGPETWNHGVSAATTSEDISGTEPGHEVPLLGGQSPPVSADSEA